MVTMSIVHWLFFLEKKIVPLDQPRENIGCLSRSTPLKFNKC